MSRYYCLSFVAAACIALFTGCTESPEKTPDQLGKLVDTLPPLKEEPNLFPPIEGHEDCKVTGENAYDF